MIQSFQYPASREERDCGQADTGLDKALRLKC